jgi:hypothetical protein
MSEITVDAWLYGTLALYGSNEEHVSFAHRQVILPEGSTLADLLIRLRMPTEEERHGFTLMETMLRISLIKTR